MYRHELYKLFTRKSLYAAFILFLLFPLLSSGSNELIQTEHYQALHDEWSGPVTEEKVEQANQKLVELEENADLQDLGNGDYVIDYSSLGIERQIELNVYNEVVDAAIRSDSLDERRQDLRLEADNLNEESFDYAQTSRKLSMLENLDQPFGFYNTSSWLRTIDFINVFNVIILSIMIVLGLSTVFAEEHSNKTVELILYTKHGKKKLVTAKIFASLTYVVALFAVTNIYNIISNLLAFGMLQDGGAPLQNIFLYLQSPFDFSVSQYYVVALTVQFVAVIAFSLLVLFLSVITRNSLLTFFISGGILGIPFFLNQLGLEQRFIGYIVNFSYYELIRVKGLFDQFRAFNLFGFPVLYPYLLLSFILTLSVLLVVIFYRVHRNQDITY